jgi:hypothetical protein
MNKGSTNSLLNGSSSVSFEELEFDKGDLFQLCNLQLRLHGLTSGYFFKPLLF